MDFTLLYTKNTEQAVLRDFNPDQLLSSKTIGLEEAKQSHISGFIFAEDLKSDDFLSNLEQELKFYPIRSHLEFDLTLEKFEALNYEAAKKVFEKMHENWILQNNLSLLQEIFKVKKHLLETLPNDRSGFFEELWFLLKRNLGAHNIKLIYNDIIKSKNENEKNKLVRVKVQGTRYPELVSCDEMDEYVLKNYEKNFGSHFEITDYNKDKGQLVICATIKKSPVLIMANIYQLSALQKALLTTLFEGLNS